MLHHKRRTDHNQASIVQALQKLGYFVTDLSAVGKGCPDLLVTNAKHCYLCEIKNTTTRKARFTQVQAEYYLQQQWPIYVLTSIDDVLSLNIGTLRPQKNGLSAHTVKKKTSTENNRAD